MKTKNLILLIAVFISTVTISFAQDGKTHSTILASFSFTEYLLMSLCGIMLMVIWLLARTIKSLSEQMR